jgi:tetratricopeptide (TPR) repeat protein
LTAANEEFAMTVAVADELDLMDLSFWSEVKSFLASLRRDQRDFLAAVREARAAGALCRAAGEPRNEVKARWQLASIYEQIRDFGAALVAVQQAVPLARTAGDPVLEMGVCHSEIVILARTGRFPEAQAKYESLLPLYLQMPDRENFRLWAWSLISAGLGRASDAETAFRAARDGFLAAKNAYDAALVTLDWTLFLLDQNRPEAVLPLAVSMGQAFEGLGVARETLASWNVFAEAAARRELTRTAAEGLVRSLGCERAAPQKPR